MVFQDISASFELNLLGQKKSTANLMDRFFSFMIDYLVISPFVLFLLYTTFNNGFNFWKQNPMADENELFVLIFSIGYVAYFSLIQSLFIALWRATPGQHFLKIRCEFHEGQELIFLRALARQLSFWLSFALLGIPFLSVMTNKKRRTFYDRVGDISIVSTKNEYESFTYDMEFRYWQSFVATLVVFVGFLFSVIIWKNYTKIVNRSASFAALYEKHYFCSEIENVNGDDRLQVAVALNFAGQLTDSCLDREADFVLWKQKFSDYSLAYYAKSLTTDNPEKEKSYLEQACAGQQTEKFSSLTQGCKIANSFLTGETEKLYGEMKGANFLDDSMKYELGLVLGKREDLTDNLAKIDKYNSIKLVRKYQIIEMLSQDSATPNRAPANAEDQIDPERMDKIINLLEGL